MIITLPPDPFSFLFGFAVGIVFVWLWGRFRPLLKQVRESAREQREAAQTRRTTGLEDNHRRITLRRAQGMHLAASLFSLDEILQEPRLIAPPARVEPGVVGLQDDIISQTLPYMPAWPELAAIYRAPTIGVAEAIAGGSNVVIVGAAGTGKTVALAHLASLAANLRVKLSADSELEAVPYLYHVADLQLPFDGGKDPANLIINAAAEHAPIFDLRRLPGFIQQTFKSGQALVLIDGYDELDPQGQRNAVEWFKALLQAYPKTRIVTTGCIDQLNGLVGLGFNPMAVIGWDVPKSSRFVQQWGEIWSRTVALEAWAQTGPEQVDPILLNTWLGTDNTNLTPLELTLKVWGAYAGDSLGPRVLDAIATHVRRIAPSGTPVAALELLAMQVVLTCQPVFDPRQARSWVKQYDVVEDKALESAESVTETAEGEKVTLTDSQKIKIKKSKAKEAAPSYGLLSKMVDSGLLVSHLNNRMRFLHPILNGYLAGQAIGDNHADATLLALPDWDGKTVSLRYLAARSDATSAADTLLKESDLPLYNHIFVVARWLRDAPREAAWRSKVFGSLLTIIQADGQPLGLRGQAMAAFVTSGDPGAPTLFRQLLSSRSFDLLPLAALGSGALKDVKAIDALEELMRAPVGSVRRAVCVALVAIGTEKSLEGVARALLQGDEELRRAAAEALANDPVEGHAMLKEGATLEDIMLRRAVVHGLSRVGQPWAVEMLQHLQVEDDQWAVRNLANQYLEQMQNIDPRVPRPLTTPSEAPWLIEFAGKQKMGVPRGGPATDILLSAFKLGSTEERLAALPYLKRVANEGVISALYHAMYGEDPEVREAAFYAIEEIGADGFKLPHPNQFGLG
ncbi:MAG TPA: HEAT repeat domain-containing protein [Anaerolineales bacterium]|nr:HEAT repeat domain-containing protein [Anaerolineales bacterium]